MFLSLSSATPSFATNDPSARPSDLSLFTENLKKSVAVVDCGFQGVGFFGSYQISDSLKQNGFNSLLVTNKSLTQNCIDRKRELLITAGSEHPKNNIQTYHGTGIDFVSFRTGYIPEKTLDLYDTYKPEIGWWVMVVIYDSYKGLIFAESRITKIADNGILEVEPVTPAPKFLSGLVVSSQGNFLGLITNVEYGGLPAPGKWKVHGAKLQCSSDPGEHTITSCTNINAIWKTKYISNSTNNGVLTTPSPSASPTTNSDISTDNEMIEQEILMGENPESTSVSKKQFVIDAIATSGLEIDFKSNTPLTCKVVSGVVSLLKVGNCQIELSQNGDDEYLPADNQIIEISITPINSTITCIKGKLIKKVTGINPKCPSGYKKK